jgi:hypothetical protein
MVVHLVETNSIYTKMYSKFLTETGQKETNRNLQDGCNSINHIYQALGAATVCAILGN